MMAHRSIFQVVFLISCRFQKAVASGDLAVAPSRRDFTGTLFVGEVALA